MCKTAGPSSGTNRRLEEQELTGQRDLSDRK